MDRKAFPNPDPLVASVHLPSDLSALVIDSERFSIHSNAMPADRGRSSGQTGPSEGDAYQLAPAWSKGASVIDGLSQGEASRFEQELHPLRRTTAHRRRKAPNHIPRPPNAFILFRSSFIKSRHVSTEVETNHSTLSKIIGLTWQNLSEAERQKWHAQAKLALDEHKRQFPQYSFRPVHTKSKGGASERRKLREVGPKDQKRCAKIAELLVCGKKGHELEEAIQEFDKHHVPEIVTRFDTPMTANTYTSTASTSERRSSSPVASRKQISLPRRKSHATSVLKPAALPLQDRSSAQIPKLSLTTESFDTFSQSPSFDFDSFSFAVDEPSMGLPDVNFTMAPETPAVHAFETQMQDPTHLSPNSQYPATMDEWRHGSPLSNSTSSAPTTPLQLCVPFPEQFAESYNPGVFHASQATADYAPTDGAYCDFTQYPNFASTLPPAGYACGPDTGAKDPAQANCGAALDGRFNQPSINAAHLEESFDLTSFMQMASLAGAGYSL